MYTLCRVQFKLLAMVTIMSRHLCWSNSTIGDIERLFNQTIVATDHRYRPTSNQSQPTLVYLSMMLLSLADFDEVRQSMSANVLLTVTWLDEIRKWDPDKFGGLTEVHPDQLDIWRPRLFLFNSVADRDMFKDAPLTIYSTGLTKWRPGAILNTFCPMKLIHYPFDTQTCTLSFTTGESNKTLRLLTVSQNVSLSNFDVHGEWLVDTSEVQSLTISDKSIVKFVLKLKRMSSFALLNIVIPVNIISSLSYLTFIMPLRSGERVSFSITVLLSLTVYTGQISEDLPTNSESLPLLVMYLTCLLLHSGLGIVANLVMLIKYHASRTVSEMGGRISNGKRSESEFGQMTTKPVFPLEFNGASQKSTTNNENDGTDLEGTTLSKRRSRSNLLPKKSTDCRPNGRCLEMDGLCLRGTDNPGQSTANVSCLARTISFVTRYMNPIDLILFLVFFVLWLVITVVFMALMMSGIP